MNCRRSENLIPLYVEGDLASRVAAQLSSHLEWCGRCNWLVDEYKESQSWLRSSSAPEFDDAQLKALKAGVLKRVADTSSKPSLLAILTQQLSRKQVFAMSTAVLIVVGIVLLYVYQTRAKVDVPIPRVAESDSSEATRKPEELNLAAGPAKASGARLKKRRKPNRRYAASQPEPALATRAVDQSGSQAGEEAESGVRPSNSSEHAVSSPAVLRIEIQTTDPNIRIIWFAPKETDSHQTKPATD